MSGRRELVRDLSGDHAKDRRVKDGVVEVSEDDRGMLEGEGTSKPIDGKELSPLQFYWNAFRQGLELWENRLQGQKAAKQGSLLSTEERGLPADPDLKKPINDFDPMPVDSEEENMQKSAAALLKFKEIILQTQAEKERFLSSESRITFIVPLSQLTVEEAILVTGKQIGLADEYISVVRTIKSMESDPQKEQFVFTCLITERTESAIFEKMAEGIYKRFVDDLSNLEAAVPNTLDITLSYLRIPSSSVLAKVIESFNVYENWQIQNVENNGEVTDVTFKKRNF